MAFIKLQHVILSQIHFNKSQGRAYIRGGLGISGFYIGFVVITALNI